MIYNHPRLGYKPKKFKEVILYFAGDNMTTSISAVGFILSGKESEMIDTKLKRIAYAEDLIVDLSMKIKHEKEYIFDTTVHFRWGTQAHVSEQDYDFAAALNKMMDILDNKIKKEKDKAQEKN